MSSYDLDFLVIGGGSGGVRAGRIAASHGARTAVVEAARLGGTCVNVGCVPKKLMVMASHYGEEVEDARGFGWSIEPGRHDWSALIEAKDTEIARLNRIYRQLLEGAGAEVIEGWARFEGPNEVRVGDRLITAERILVATGGRPVLPDLPGAREFGMVSDDVFTLPERPGRLVVVGGGYIAVEFAGVFAALGSEVTQVIRGDLPLTGFDHDIRTHLAEEMTKAGVTLKTRTTIAGIAANGAGRLVTLSEGTVVEADRVLFATGRSPNTDGLGLAAAGIATNGAGAIVVDDALRSSVPSAYAVGDVIDRVKLTPVAIAEGHAVADRLFGDGGRVVDYDAVPTAVFSNPQVGTVGLSEEAAVGRGHKVDLYRSVFRPMRHTLSGRDRKTMMKLVVDRESDRVLGLHIVGEDAAEMLQGFAVAITCGATKAQFDRTIGIHPTAAEELVTMRTKLSRTEVATEEAAA